MTDQRRDQVYAWLLRVGGVLIVVLLAAVGVLAAVQTQRVDNLRSIVSSERADASDGAKTAAAQYSALSAQYSKLFEACQKSAECLAHAPSQVAPVIIQGAPGSPGKSVTPADIAAALNAYCQAHSNCIGDQGTVGPTGATGANGADGANGAAGPAGPAGTDGRGVQTISCVYLDTFTTAFQFTLTDGTVFNVPGQCTPPTDGVN